MDLGEEKQKLLDADMELDEDHVDKLKAVALATIRNWNTKELEKK